MWRRRGDTSHVLHQCGQTFNESVIFQHLSSLPTDTSDNHMEGSIITLNGSHPCAPPWTFSTVSSPVGHYSQLPHESFMHWDEFLIIVTAEYKCTRCNSLVSHRSSVHREHKAWHSFSLFIQPLVTLLPKANLCKGSVVWVTCDKYLNEDRKIKHS